MEELKAQLESILFVANKPATPALLAKLCEKEETEVLAALQSLQEARKASGIIIMEANGQWQLSTNPQNVNLVKNYLTADLREKLTDATVEVLGIIAYRQPISKAEIEAIRGVNCQYSIRQLLMRGLIEKVVNPADSRSAHYQLTTEFLQHMGLQSVSDLPEFEKLTASIKLPETPQAKAEAAEAEAAPVQATSYTDPVANFPTTPQNVSAPAVPPVFSEPETPVTPQPEPQAQAWQEPAPQHTAYTPVQPAYAPYTPPTPAPVTPAATPAATEEDEFIDDDEEDDDEE